MASCLMSALRELLAPWILVTAIAAVVVALPSWGLSAWDIGKASDGSTGSSHHWRASPDGTRFYESVNREPEREITQAQYEDLERGLFSGFARIWVLFSFFSLVMWRFVALRWKDELSPDWAADLAAPASKSAGLPASSRTLKSTAAIVAIWMLGIGANLLSFVLGPQDVSCTAAVPPEMQWIVLLVPPIFFCGAAFFTKRSPFISPWISEAICGLQDSEVRIAGNNDGR